MAHETPKDPPKGTRRFLLHVDAPSSVRLASKSNLLLAGAGKSNS